MTEKLTGCCEREGLTEGILEEGDVQAVSPSYE